MRIVALAASALLLPLLVPTAGAAPTDECPPPLAEPCRIADPLVVVIRHRANETASYASQLVASLGGQPLVRVVNLTHGLVCANPENFHCRVVSGRPVTGGAFELCGDRAPANAPFRGPYWYALHGGEWRFGAVTYTFPLGVEPTLRNATSTVLAGTALEGESICHDHWTTLRALATLP